MHKPAFVVIFKGLRIEIVRLLFINVYLPSLKALFIHGSNLERKKKINLPSLSPLATGYNP